MSAISIAIHLILIPLIKRFSTVKVDRGVVKKSKTQKKHQHGAGSDQFLTPCDVGEYGKTKVLSPCLTSKPIFYFFVGTEC